MRRKVIMFLILAMCFWAAGCGKEEEPEQEQREASGVEITNEESSDGGTEQGKVYTVSIEDGQASIDIAVPEGYKYQDYSSATNVTYASEDSNQVIMVSLVNEEESALEERIKQEVAYQTSANGNGNETIEEVQTASSGGQNIFYFHYAYEGLKGCRIWTMMENGCFLTVTAENTGSNLSEIDGVYLINQLLFVDK